MVRTDKEMKKVVKIDRKMDDADAKT